MSFAGSAVSALPEKVPLPAVTGGARGAKLLTGGPAQPDCRSAPDRPADGLANALPGKVPPPIAVTGAGTSTGAAGSGRVALGGLGDGLSSNVTVEEPPITSALWLRSAPHAARTRGAGALPW